VHRNTVLPDDLCGHEILPLALEKGHGLRVFNKLKLKKISNYVDGGW
jgi:hypothetical protein